MKDVYIMMQFLRIKSSECRMRKDSKTILPRPVQSFPSFFHPSLGESCPKSNGGSGNPSSGHKTRMGDRPSVSPPLRFPPKPNGSVPPLRQDWSEISGPFPSSLSFFLPSSL